MKTMHQHLGGSSSILVILVESLLASVILIGIGKTIANRTKSLHSRKKPYKQMVTIQWDMCMEEVNMRYKEQLTESGRIVEQTRTCILEQDCLEVRAWLSCCTSLGLVSRSKMGINIK